MPLVSALVSRMILLFLVVLDISINRWLKKDERLLKRLASRITLSLVRIFTRSLPWNMSIFKIKNPLLTLSVTYR